MKILLLIVCTGILSANARSHNYYFGFAEMQYNEINHTLETTIVLSAHDFETILLKSNTISKSLEYLTHDSLALAAVEAHVLSSFKVHFEGKIANFHLLGFEISSTGMIQIYLLSENIFLDKEIDITFSTMMDVFEVQQNKLTFIQNNNKQTAVFMQNQKSSVIHLVK